MAYSTNPYTLNKILSSYAPLLSGKVAVWHKPPGAPARWPGWWSYKLREGLSIARRYPTQFQSLAAIADRVNISIKNESVVAEVQAEAPVATTESRAVAEVATAPHVASIDEVIDIHRICADWDDQHVHQTKLHYPVTSLTSPELIDLSAWLAERGWMLLRSRNGALTLAPDDPDVPAEARVPH